MLNKLIAWLNVPILISIAILQVYEGVYAGQPISIELGAGIRSAWVLVVSIGLTLALIITRHVSRREWLMVALTSTSLLGIVVTLCIDPMLTMHDACLVAVAVVSFVWMLIVGVTYRSRAFLISCAAVVCLCPVMAYLGVGLIEKALILLFLAAAWLTRVQRPGESQTIAVGLPAAIVAVFVAIAISTGLSVVAATRGLQYRSMMDHAQELQRAGTMPALDWLRLSGIAGRPLSDDNLRLAEYRIGHPIKSTEDARLGARLEVLSLLGFAATYSPAQLKRVDSIAVTSLASPVGVERIFALRLVIRTRGKGAIPIVQSMSHDPDRFVRGGAQAILARLPEKMSLQSVK